jgi:hypothetical protein
MNLVKLLIFALCSFSICASDPLRHENEGCTENSQCSKETGKIRQNWLEIIKSISDNKISEKFANETVFKKTGIPISIWAREDATKQNSPLILWNSPCKQHQDKNNIIFIGEVFTSKLSEIKNLILQKAIFKENGVIKTINLPRGDAPINIINNSFYYTKDDEGIFYGLNISITGELKISKPIHIEKFPKEVDCPKDMIEEFYRNAPSLNFYKGSFCKEIWNQNKKQYSLLLLGWSCN